MPVSWSWPAARRWGSIWADKTVGLLAAGLKQLPSLWGFLCVFTVRGVDRPNADTIGRAIVGLGDEKGPTQISTAKVRGSDHEHFLCRFGR